MIKTSFALEDVIQKAGGAEKILDQTGKANIRVGVIAFSLGAGPTVLNYIISKSIGGGGYYIFHGAMVFGLIQILRGISERRKGRRFAP